MVPTPRAETTVTTTNGELLIQGSDFDDTLWLTALPGGTLRVEVEKQDVRSVLGGEQPLVGIRSIRVDAGGGRNAVNIAGAEGVVFPAMHVNGGAGDDTVSFTGPIVLAPGAGLEVDLQDDAPVPGTDSVHFAPGSSVIASGTGSIVVRVNRRISVTQADLQVVDGSITLEANQQTEPVRGEGSSILVDSGNIRSEGKGGITINGRGGGVGRYPHGVEIKEKALVQGGSGEPLRITGRGLDGVEDDDAGVAIRGRTASPRVTSNGADIFITGTGGSTPRKSGHNRGIALSEGRIEAVGMGRIVLTGTGGNAFGPYNQGILAISAKAAVISNGGDVILDGTGGGIPDGDQFNDGVVFWKGATLRVGGTGKLTITGTAKNLGTGIAIDESCAIAVEAGEIHLTAKGSSAEVPDIRVKKSSTITAKGGGKITIDAGTRDIEDGSLREGAR